MPRTFPAYFLDQALAQHNMPYMVLEVQWGGAIGTKYYIDREQGTFEAVGLRHPTVENCLVVDWGVPGQSLREMQVGSVDTITVKIEDRGGALQTIFNDAPQQHRTVKVWRMFDNDFVVWPDSAGLIFVGVTKPFSYTETDNVVSFEVEDPARQLVGTVECRATRALFSSVAPDHEDKNIPLVWGYAERVEGVLIKKPWTTRLVQGLEVGLGLGARFDLDDHPDEIGAPVDTEIDVYVGPIDGDDRAQLLRGVLRQSADKAQFPSTFEITGYGGMQVYDVSISAVTNAGTPYAGCLLYDPALVTNQILYHALHDGKRITIQQGDVIRSTTLGNTGTDTSNRLYTPQFISFADPEVNANLAVGQVVRIWYRSISFQVSAYTIRESNPYTSPFTNAPVTYLDFYEDDILPADFVGRLDDFYPAPRMATVIMGSGGINYVDLFPLTYTALERGVPETGMYRMTAHVDLDHMAEWRTLVDSLPVVTFLHAGPSMNNTGVVTTSFEAGTTIRPVSGDWVYAVNALPSKQIVKVEGYGTAHDERNDGSKGFVLIADETTRAAGDTKVRTYTSTDWTAELNDDTWSGTLGRNITTITFARSPRLTNSRLDDNRIWVSLFGIEDEGDGTGDVIYNPATVLKTYLTHPKLMNISTDYINVTSFNDAATSQELVSRKVGFAVPDAADGLTLLQDIARQCRSSLFFDQGKFALKVLLNDPFSYSASFNEATVLTDSLKIQESDVYDLTSRITAHWRYRWDDKNPPRRRVAVNAALEEEFPVNNRELDLWLYNDPLHVADELTFWLERWSRLYRNVTFTAFGRGLALQPGDWIILSYTDGTGRQIIPISTKCEVQEVKDKAPSGLFEIQARYVAFTF